MTAARAKISALMIYILRTNSREVLSMRFILNTSEGSLGEAEDDSDNRCLDPDAGQWFEIQGTLLFPLPEGELILSRYLRFQGVQSNRMRASANRYLRSAAHASTFSDFRT